MSTDLDNLEARLRAMYAAVADATVVDDTVDMPDTAPGDSPSTSTLEVVDGRHAAAPRRRLVLAAAVVLAVLAAVGLLWSAARRPSEPAGPMDGRTIAVPMHLPEGYGYDQAGVNLQAGLGQVFSAPSPTSEVALVILRGPSTGAGLSVGGYAELLVASTTDRSVTPNPDAEQVTLSSGAVAYLLASPDLDRIELGWREVDGPTVMMRADGVSRADLIDVANGMWYTTRAEFDRLTSKAGFRKSGGPQWDIPGDGHLRAQVSGSLQEGLGVHVAVRNEPSGYSFVRVNPLCAAQYVAGDPEGPMEVLLFGPVGTTSFTVTLPDGTRFGPFPAGTPAGLPSTQLGDAVLPVGLGNMNRVGVRCDGAES